MTVALYQRTGSPDRPGYLGIDNTPEITGTTDSRGIVALNNRPFGRGAATLNGHQMRDNPFGVIDIIGNQNLFLIQLVSSEHEEFRWLDITEFNLAYWLGDTISHTFIISSHVPPPGAPSAPSLSTLQVAGDQAQLCWKPSSSPGIVGYRVYRAALPRFLYTPVGYVTAATCFEESYPASSYGGKLYAVTAVDAQGQESGFSNFGWAPSLTNPTAVVITPQGERTILDPRNGYALIRQDSQARYRQYIGSIEYHLEFSQFMAQDAVGHLLFSHPGDYYDPRHSVRVATATGQPLLEFGERGSGPGQFENPTGVAAWGDACEYGGPYQDDPHALLLLHLDGDYEGVQGEAGTANGTSFTSGKFGQGVLIDATDTLTYPTAGNLNQAAGTIEFWVRPNQEGDYGQIHVLFEIDYMDHGIQIAKHGGGNLHFLMRSGEQLTDIHAPASHWRSGEWHHVTATWQGTHMALYIDGLPQAGSDSASPPQMLGPVFYLGSSPRGDWQADAIIDEFRISDIPRLGSNQPCNRIIVADSGNHRIQAFDELGNFLDEFGRLRIAERRFNTPQGLAVDPSGRVIVVDQGNNRLVLLNFDGYSFDYSANFTAGFDNPTGVTTDLWGNLYVADSGNDRIVVLDAAGNLLDQLTQPDDGSAGSFYAPRGLAIEEDGDIVVADTGNQRVVTIRHWLGLQRVYLPLVGH